MFDPVSGPSAQTLWPGPVSRPRVPAQGLSASCWRLWCLSSLATLQAWSGLCDVEVRCSTSCSCSTWLPVVFIFSPISMTSAVTLDAMRSTIVPADVFIINRIECDGGMLKLIAMLDKQGVPGILLDAACTSSFVLVISVPAAVG